MMHDLVESGLGPEPSYPSIFAKLVRAELTQPTACALAASSLRAVTIETCHRANRN
jgi:hypothetical protein